DMKVKEGKKDFVISSSGNAALAAIRHIKKLNDEIKKSGGQKDDFLTLSVLLGTKVNQEKKQIILSEVKDENNKRDENIDVTEFERPIQVLFEKVKKDHKESLRQSTDDTALIGYKSLAEEISQIEDVGDIFMGISSGTAIQAIADYLI